MDGRFYWLKLKRDFFKRHDIQIIEGMPDGKEYLLFYLKLLCESVDHDGRLRFSDEIPYTEEMLAVVTNTDPVIVSSAIQKLTELGLIKLLDDDTYYMTEIEHMIGSAANNDNANRQRKYREKQKSVTQPLPKCYASVTKNNESKSKNNIKEISKEKKFKPPTLEEVESYCKQRNNNVNPKIFYDYFTEGDWKDSKGSPVKNWKQKVITWEKFDKPFKQPKKNKFTDIKQNEYDFDALEEALTKGGLP